MNGLSRLMRDPMQSFGCADPHRHTAPVDRARIEAGACQSSNVDYQSSAMFSD
jgi:hypothetical protein